MTRKRGRNTKNNNRNRKGRRRRVSKPAAAGVRNRNRNPLERIRISNRELIATLNGSTDDEDRFTYEVNPGLPSTFPWLSSIANAFESYKFRQLSFEFVPAVSTTADGSVYLGMDFDPTDDNSKLSIVQLAQFAGSVKGPIWDTGLTYRAKASDLSKRKSFFVRSNNVPITNRAVYDVGTMLLVLTSSFGASYFGDLYVHYDVEFSTPQTEPDDEAVFSITSGTVNPNEPFIEGMYNVAQDLAPEISVYSTDQLQFTQPDRTYLFTAQGDDAAGITAVNGLSPNLGFGATVTKLSEAVNGSGTAFAITWKIVTAAAVSVLTPLILGWAGIDASDAGTITLNILGINDAAELLAA